MITVNINFSLVSLCVGLSKKKSDTQLVPLEEVDRPAPPSPRPWYLTGKGGLPSSGLEGERLPQVEEFKYLGGYGVRV